MKKNYVVAIVEGADGGSIAKVYPVSAETGAEDVTYPPQTLLFFFVQTEKTREQVGSEYMSVQVMNQDHMFLCDTMSAADTYYIPSENKRLLSNRVHFQNGEMSLQTLIERGVFKVV